MLSRLRRDGILIRCKLYSKQQQEVPVTPLGGKDSAARYGRERGVRHGASRRTRFRNPLDFKWISDFRMDFGFQNGFLDFKVDFWISKWISGFQSGFLDFKADF